MQASVSHDECNMINLFTGQWSPQMKPTDKDLSAVDLGRVKTELINQRQVVAVYESMSVHCGDLFIKINDICVLSDTSIGRRLLSIEDFNRWSDRSVDMKIKEDGGCFLIDTMKFYTMLRGCILPSELFEFES